MLDVDADDTTEKPPAHLRELLVRLRGERTVPEVAEAIGVTEAAVYFWESTKTHSRMPSPANLQALLDLYEANEAVQALAWRLRAARQATAGAA